VADASTTAADSVQRVRRLVERAQQGEREALEELYLIHFDRIYSYLHMSVGNRQDAEDLTTQTFLKMLESNADVAAILGKTEGAVKSLQHRALVSLQKQISRK
jgi:DNA-directed RNA polymerase specialized sigma24 family protein